MNFYQIQNPTITNPTMNFNPKITTTTNTNTNYYQNNKPKIYPNPYTTNNPQTYNSPLDYRNQNYRTNSGRKLQYSGSRIGQLNDRLTQQTQMIRVRNQLRRKNMEVRSSSSQLRRSRLSADWKRRPAVEFMEYGRGSNYQPLRYQSQTQSLTSSRASQQLLRKPIISYVRQPISYAQNVNFRKQKPVQFMEDISRKPIIQTAHHPIYRMKSAETQAVPYFKVSSQGDSRIKINEPVKNQQEFEEFLDMDFNQNRPQQMETFRSNHQEHEQEPVSPVTYNAHPIVRNSSEKQQRPISFDSSLKNSNRSVQRSTSFVKRVTEMIEKFDYEGRKITMILVGIGIILVIFQLIR